MNRCLISTDKPLHRERHEFESLDHASAEFAAEVAQKPYLLIDVLNTIYDRVYLKDSEGKVTFVNQAFLKTYRLVADDVIGKHLRDFLPAEMVAPCEAADRHVVDNGEGMCLETQWTDTTSGELHSSETHKAPLRDAAGNVIGIVGISRDTTARRRTEEELNRQKTLLELIIETVPDWIVVKDRERRVMLGNHAYYAEHGLDPENTKGTDPSTQLPRETQRVSRDTDNYVLQTGKPCTGDATLANGDGNDRYMEFRKLPLVEDGEITGVVSVCRDLTEWKLAEEQSKRNESLLLHAARLSSLGELAAGIAHEVNQPLFSILNYAKAIENKLQSGEQLDLESIRKWVDQIHKEAARGGKITSRLKSFVKPSSASRESSDINALVLESIEFMRIEARDAGVKIETDLADDLLKVVLDRIQIQQVLVNLVMNALEACTESATDYAHVTISTRQQDELITVSVADNGPGLPADSEVCILDPFQTTKRDGVGLGLAISKTIVESHQSHLTYETNQWGGATFQFALPTNS